MTLVDSLRLSPLASDSDNWITAPDLTQSLQADPGIFLSVITYLIANPNHETSHLFRADILYDSAGILKTPGDKEKELLHVVERKEPVGKRHHNSPLAAEFARPARLVPGFELKRTAVRRLIPRKPQVDRPLEQTCHFYESTASGDCNGGRQATQGHLVVYTPHVSGESELPWYHPAVRGIAFLFEFCASERNTSEGRLCGCGTLSLHFLPFLPGIPRELPTRLQRTLLSLLSTQLRLIRGTSQDPSDRNKPKPYKDNIIPQHILQDTYTRLKEKYAAYLVSKWVEETEPSKHVFEDLGIAAFLIELWKLMYTFENDSSRRSEDGDSSQTNCKPPFAGFVDIACGNGVLVHILLSEGYDGWGFDARRRKSWSIFPQSTQDRLREFICIPHPFEDALSLRSPNPMPSYLETHPGLFEKDTFIISNHADELTIWTPLLGALSNPIRPLPFLAIPCCSHALSGARYRFPPPKKTSKQSDETSKGAKGEDHESAPELDPQPATGDLKALRAAKQAARQDPADVASAYGCLTAKVVDLAEEIGYDVEKTMLRIPSTRNMGVIGGLKAWKSGEEVNSLVDETERRLNMDQEDGKREQTLRCIEEVLKRETMKDGGVEEAAKLWIERAVKLQGDQNRGTLRGGAQHS
ncbi:hypothetical protein VTO42DRAFT_7817 [Malbranchea cinnamomea]